MWLVHKAIYDFERPPVYGQKSEQKLWPNWQKPFWTVSGSWRLHMSNAGIGPGLGFLNTSCSLRQCKVCVAFFSQWVICPCRYMAISVVQFSSYLLSLGTFTYLLVCPLIIEIFHFLRHAHWRDRWLAIINHRVENTHIRETKNQNRNHT